MYRRIFSVDPPFRLQSLLIGIVVALFWLVTTIATVVNCIPLEYSWISLSDPAHCFNYNIFWMVTGALEVVIDTFILALPVRMVLGLQLSNKRKILLLFIFLLGGLYVFPPSSPFSRTDSWLTPPALSSRVSSALFMATCPAAASLRTPRQSSGRASTLGRL